MAIASATMLAAPLPEAARPARSRIPATTGAPWMGADRGRQRRQAPAQHLPAADLGVPETPALLGMPKHRAQQRVDIDEHLGLDAGQQPAGLDKVDQMGPRH
ncbi:hypothetical protein GCM10023317_86690 [Actinopolymorpha pittospori]|uniref:Uncharacterized protein n=1 Tax=Actinopolymorpha pittospori TaxID=648752 RepID=A0A927RKW0_9ACTN|nr:hypothetical protein [Actinopolymorpha pittospori]